VDESIILKRDCEAVLIPAGTKITLQAGEPVTVTQALGGSFTVIIHGNMARVAGKDADALGKERQSQPPLENAASLGTQAVSKETPDLTEEDVLNTLRTCYDPEIPVNIVDLGLVYDLQILPLPDTAEKRIEIKMTLTAPGCGMGPVLQQDVENKVLALPGVKEAGVFLVWEPQWNREMLSEAAKLQLGLM
jgi:probable FeS assembly SUF system protein SufT